MDSQDFLLESFQHFELRLFSDPAGMRKQQDAAMVSITAPGSGEWRDDACVWSWTANVERVANSPGMVELCLRLELLEGHSEATQLAVDLGIPKWTAQHYLVIPGAVYDGNRRPCRTFRYPPFLADEDICGAQTQSWVGDILWGGGATGIMPRLAGGTASSALSLRANDCAMPALGVYDPIQQLGQWWFIEHRTRLGNSGIAVEESTDQSSANLRFSFPGKRCYGIPAEAERMPDWKTGDKLEIRIRRATFACTSRPGLLMGWLPLRHGLEPAPVWFNDFPLSAAAGLIEEKFNRDNWDEERGLYLFSGLDSNAHFHYLEKEIAIQRFLGYDMIQVPGGPAFSLAAANDSLDSVQSTDKVARGPIQSWKDFEEYEWPSATSLDTRPLEWLEKNIPDGMKCYVTVPVGYYKFLFGIESLFYLIYDEPELVSAVLTKLQNIYVEYCSIVSQFSCVGALWSSDDMGFKTQTLLPPDFIKQNILPVHRACAEIAHQKGKLFFLHSCGNLSSVMDAIIGIGIDAKHSFEDQILPVEQAKALYGDKIALLGGLDMDFLCRAEESALRARVRQLLDQCHPGGGYCLGSGNSIAKYVPVDNYLIMLDEGRKYGK